MQVYTAKALNSLLLKDGAPDTHAHTQIPQKKKDLPASRGPCRSGSAGLEPAARYRCKHRVRRQRRAPARSINGGMRPDASDEIGPDERRADQTRLERSDQTTRPRALAAQTQFSLCSPFLRRSLLRSADGPFSADRVLRHALIRQIACYGPAFLQRTAPRLGLCVAHWVGNDAFSDLAPGQNEALRERANSADDSSSRRCCSKNPNYQNNCAAHVHLIPIRHRMGF